jgi:hypothetical protein
MSPGHLMAHFTNSLRTVSIDTVFCCRGHQFISPVFNLIPPRKRDHVAVWGRCKAITLGIIVNLFCGKTWLPARYSDIHRESVACGTCERCLLGPCAALEAVACETREEVPRGTFSVGAVCNTSGSGLRDEGGLEGPLQTALSLTTTPQLSSLSLSLS